MRVALRITDSNTATAEAEAQAEAQAEAEAQAAIPAEPTPEGIPLPEGHDLVPTDYIQRTVDRQDRVPVVDRSHNSNSLHVSTVIRGFCQRQNVLSSYNDQVVYQKYISGNMRIVWTQGRATEDHIRKQFIAAKEFQGIIGTWVCDCGKQEVSMAGEHTRGAECDVCGSKLNTYKELLLVDTEIKLVGSPDLLIVINNKIYIVEIKSMNKEDFEKLQAPVPEHIYQGAAYRRLLVANNPFGLEVSPDIIVMYARKDFKFTGSPYKEFHVDAQDNPLVNSVLDVAWNAARFVTQHKEAKTLPDRTDCESITCTKAKNCPYAVECFSRG